MENEITTRTANLVTAGSVEELYKSWSEFIQGTPRTVETYTKAVGRFLFFLRENGITNPTRVDVKTYKEELEKNHKPTTVNAYLMAVKQFFKWAEDEGLYKNIARNVKGAKLDEGFKKDYLTSSQVKKILETVNRSTLQGKRDYAILTLMVTCGLRDVEVVRANAEDVRNVADFTALFLQGKGHQERTQYVKLVNEVEEALREYMQARGQASGTEPLFTAISNRNQDGRLTTRSVSRMVKGYMVKAGYDSNTLTAHSLRHTTATLNLLAGGTIEETQQLLRHKDIKTTLIYSHALTRENNNSEKRVAGLIFG